MSVKFVAGFLAGIILVVSVWYLFPDIRESLFHDGQPDHVISLVTALEEKKGAMQEADLQNKSDAIDRSDAGDSMETESPFHQNTVEKGIDTADAVIGQGDGEADMEKHIQEQNSVSWAEVDRSSPEVEDEQEEEGKAVGERGEGKLEGVLPKSKTDDAVPDASEMTNQVSLMDASGNPPDKVDDALDKKEIEIVSTASDEKEKFFFWKPFFLESKAKKFAAHITSGSNVTCLVDKIGTGNYQVYYLYKDEADKLAKAERIKNTGITF